MSQLKYWVSLFKWCWQSNSCRTARLHIGNHRFDVSIVLSGILIVLQHLTHVFFAESQHSVEFRFGTDVSAVVESGGEVIECYGADAGHEDVVEHALETS